MITLSYSKMKKYAFSALAIPFIVFAIGWLKWYWAVVAVAASLVCIWFGSLAKSKKNQENNVVSMTDSEKKISVRSGFLSYCS